MADITASGFSTPICRNVMRSINPISPDRQTLFRTINSFYTLSLLAEDTISRGILTRLFQLGIFIYENISRPQALVGNLPFCWALPFGPLTRQEIRNGLNISPVLFIQPNQDVAGYCFDRFQEFLDIYKSVLKHVIHNIIIINTSCGLCHSSK